MSPSTVRRDVSGRKLALGNTHEVLASGGYVYKLWPPGQRAAALRHAQLQIVLAQQGVRCPLPLRDGSGAIVYETSWRGQEWIAIVMDRISPHLATPSALFDLGRQLARLHRAALPADLPVPGLGPRQCLSAIAPEVWHAFVDRVGPSVCTALVTADIGPSGLCHGDATVDNVIFVERAAWLIDFEHLRRAPVTLDLGRMALTLASLSNGVSAFSELLRGYTHGQGVHGTTGRCVRWGAVCAALELATWRLQALGNSAHARWAECVLAAVSWATEESALCRRSIRKAGRRAEIGEVARVGLADASRILDYQVWRT